MKVTFNPKPTSAAGFVSSANPGGTPALDTTSGNLFTYTPTQQDKFEFTATFSSGGTVQAVVITPVPELQPEYDTVQTTLPLPNENSTTYVTYTETPAVTTQVFNGHTVDGKFTTRSIEVSGKTITLDSSNDPLGLITHLRSPNSNIAQLTIYADTVIVRSTLALPQTNVTIYARQLTFQDPAGMATGTAGINTTPLSCSGSGPLAPSGYCSAPRNAATDANFNVGNQADKGTDGNAGGNVTLHIQQFTSTNDTLAASGGTVAATRFILNGGNGQDPGRGYSRYDSSFALSGTCNSSSSLDGVSYCHITSVPAESWTVVTGHNIFGDQTTTCSFAAVTPPSGVINIRYDCAGTIEYVPNNPAPQGACPTNGHPAAAWGQPGSGGNAGSFSTSLAVSSNGGIVQQLGGFAGALGQYAYGGFGGQPTQAYDYQVGFGGNPLYLTCAATTTAPTIPPPFPNQFTGAGGTNTTLPDATYAWLHPYAMQAILIWSRDAYRNGDFDTVHSLLNLYLPTVQAAGASTSANAAQFGQFEVEIQSILNRIDSHLDYYGNPAGWVPLFSLQATMSLLSQEVQAAIPIIGLAEQIQAISNNQAQTLAGLNSSIQNLETEVTQTAKSLTDPNTGLYVTIQTLEGQAVSLDQQVTTIQGQIASEKVALEDEAQSDVTAANQLPLWEEGLRLLGGALQVLPIYQPILGAVGQGLDLLTNINNSQNLNTQGSQIASTFTDANFTKSENQLNTLLGNIGSVLNGNTNVNVTISGFLTSVAGAYAGISKGVQTFRNAVQTNGVSQSAVAAELAKLTAQDTTLSNLVSTVNSLNSQKAQNVQSMSTALDQLTKAVASINADLSSIQNFQTEVNLQVSQVNHAATIYVKDMEKRQLDRLQKYLYYMSKAYEYRFLTPYTGSLTLDNWLTQLKTLLQTKNNILSTADIANLVSIYEDQVRQVIADGVDVMVNNPPEMSQVVKFGLTSSELNTLNTTGSVTIDLFDKIGGIPGQENQRINSLGVIGSELVVQSNAASLSTGTLNINVSYFGQSTIASGGHTYFFRFGTPQFENPFTWGGNYDLVDQIFSPNTPSVEGLSLLNAFLNNTTPTAKIASNLALFAEPGANSLITISRSVIPNSATANITTLRMSVGVDFYPSNANQVTMMVQAPPNGLPYVSVTQADVTGRTDGIGSFARVFASGTNVNLAAEPTYAGLPFLKWVDSNNNTLSATSSLKVLLTGHQTVTPLYANSGPLGPLPVSFVLSSPASGSTLISSPVTLSWTSSGSATSYNVYLGTANPPAFAGQVAVTSYIASNLQPGATYYWTVVANDAAGATPASQTWTFVSPAAAGPAVTQNPANVTVNAGSTAQFTAAATGAPAPTVQWQQSTGGTTFTNVAGATSATLSITAASSQNGYKFRAVFTNSGGSVTTTAATLTVQSTRAPCDLNGNGSADVSDVQIIINEALGATLAADDLNADGAVTVSDVQLEINAALGLGCSVTHGTLAAPSLSQLRPSDEIVSAAALTDLGTIGGLSTTAYGINSLGQVVGASGMRQPGASELLCQGRPCFSRAFLWDAGQMSELAVPFEGNATSSAAFSINDFGQIAGDYWHPDQQGGSFLYAAGHMTLLSIAPGSRVSAINNASQVVGDLSPASATSSKAFLWKAGTMTAPETFAGGGAHASAINDVGQVAGFAFVPDNSAIHAVLYDGVTSTDLGTLGGTNSVAFGVNVAGQVVGSSQIAGNRRQHAFLSSRGLMTDLGTLGGADSQANGISSRGLIVGWARTSSGDQHAFLWTAGRMLDLNNLVSLEADSVLTEATAINDVGQLVANGSNGRAYLISLPIQLQ